MRLFCALRLPEPALDGLVEWQAEHLSQGRLVARPNLHLTLAFLGSRPAGDVAPVAAALREAAGSAGEIRLRVHRYRETRSVGMIELEDVAGEAAGLAQRLARRLQALGVYEPERRPWLPHVTVLRFREQPGLRPPLPELDEVSPSDAALYHSVLRSAGAQYEVLESVALGG